AAPRRRAVPVRARDVRARDPGRGRGAVRRVQLGAARRARGGAVAAAGRCGVTATGVGPGPVGTADLGDVRLARSADGLLGLFNTAGVLDPADVHVATRIGRLGGEADEEVLLAVALAVRAVRLGSVCVDLASVSRTVLGEGDELVDTSALPWPDPARWLAACAASPVVADGPDAPGGRPRRLVDGLLYLSRYWGEEEVVRRSLTGRAAAPPTRVDLPRPRAGRSEEH